MRMYAWALGYVLARGCARVRRARFYVHVYVCSCVCVGVWVSRFTSIHASMRVRMCACVHGIGVSVYVNDFLERVRACVYLRA